MLSSFLGGLALFLFGQFLLERSLQQTSRHYLRVLVRILTKHRFIAILFGSFLTVGMQSSTVAILTLVDLVNLGILKLGQALSIMLGASIGTTIIVQVISFKITDFALWFILIGFIISRFTRYARGEILMGFGFMFYGLLLMGSGIALFKATSFGNSFLSGLCTSPFKNMLYAFILTVISQSTLATMAVGISLVSAGGVGLADIIPIIFGAHLGAGVLPLIYSWKIRGAAIARQLGLANMIFRLISVFLFIPLTKILAEIGLSISRLFNASPARELANVHTIFILISVGFFVFLASPFAGLIKRIVKEKKMPTAGPELEIPQAVMDKIKNNKIELAKKVYDIVRNSVLLWESGRLTDIENIERDNVLISSREENLAKYIIGLPKGFLDESYCEETLETMEHLKKISSIIGVGLTDLTRKRIVLGLSFSIEGLNEVLNIHKSIIEKFNILLRNPEELALINEKINLQLKESYDAHIKRIYKGFRETKETSSLHADAISFLEQINWYMQKIAKRF